MRLALIGATSNTGRAMIHAARQAGHTVIALARRPAALGDVTDGVTVLPGDVYDVDSLERAFRGCDAVLSALGRGSLMQARKPSDVLERGTANIVAAMTRSGLSRLVAVSSVGTVDDPTEEFVYRHVIKRILRQLYEDMQRMEAVVRTSGHAWTLLRPPFLTDGPATGRYCLAPGGNVPYGYRLSRADLAAFAVAELASAEFRGSVVGISYPTRRTPAEGVRRVAPAPA